MSVDIVHSPLTKWEVYEMRDLAKKLPEVEGQKLDILLDFFESRKDEYRELVVLRQETLCLKDELKECEDEKRDLEFRFAKAEDAYEAGAKKEEICAVLFR